MNRNVQWLVNAVPNGPSKSLRYTEPIGELDHLMDQVLDQLTDPDESYVRAANAALSPTQRQLVYRYGIRLLGRALTDNDASLLDRAASALVIATYHQTEDRDGMLELAPAHVVSARLTGDASETLDWIADHLPEHRRPNLRAWGRRAGITLDRFKWKETTTEDGTTVLYPF